MIGGTLSYAVLAQLHKPNTDDGVRAEAIRLHRDCGLTAQDIHVALKIPLEMVLEWLAQ